jgi:DNA-binding CsgD family transcriptional regulator
MNTDDGGAEPLLLAASCTGHREATVTLGRFHSFSEPPARRVEPQEVTPDPQPTLTRRENEVLRLLSAGSSYRAIAEELYISPETVHTHCKRIYRKLGISGRRHVRGLETSP